MKKIFHLFFILSLSAAFALAGCSETDPADDGSAVQTGDRSLKSVSATIEPVNVTSRSSSAGEVFNSGFAARVEAGQVMTVELDGDQAEYIYNGRQWVPQQRALIFPDGETHILKISLAASDDKQDGSLKALLAADELSFEGNVKFANDVSGIKLTHTGTLLELEVEEGAGEDFAVDGRTAYYHSASGVYMVVVGSSAEDLDISYTRSGQPVAATLELGGILEANWTYRVKITATGAQLENASAIESVTATIDGISGLDNVIGEFDTRWAAGQVMRLSIGNASAEYRWDGSQWIPKTLPLNYPTGMSHEIKVSLACAGALQDGSEEGFTRADQLNAVMSNHPRVADLTGVTLKRTMALVCLEFDSEDAVSDVSVDGIKAVKTDEAGYKLLIAPASKQLEVAFKVGGAEKTQKSQRVELTAGGAVTLEIAVTKDDSPETDYALDDLGLPEYLAGSKGNGPMVQLVNGKYKIYSQTPAGAASTRTVETGELGALDVYPSNPNNRFRVGLHENIDNTQWIFPKPAKVLVISDLHGEFDAFVDILKSQQVIDDNFNWIFGSNYLVMNGDAFHRGRDETPIIWLMYKLEAHAQAHGGKCMYLTSNHDDWVLQKSNTGYRNSAHRDFARNLGISKYEDLWESSYVLGKWMRERNAVIVIGDDAYVHGGIGDRMVDNNFSIARINEIAKRNIGLTSRDKEGREVFHTSTSSGGPYWLRSMVRKSMSERELTLVLNYYNIDRVICGHTEVDDVSWFYNGRVVAVNVKHKDNWANRNKAIWAKETSGALLIEGNSYYMVDYKGNKKLIGAAN